jgi:hypothetical protein
MMILLSGIAYRSLLRENAAKSSSLTVPLEKI